MTGRPCYTALSSVGGRESQQDTLFVGESEDQLLAVICDGMGGLNGGEKASELAVRMLAESFYSRRIASVPDFYRTLLPRIDEAVFGIEAGGRRIGAGSTLVSVILGPAGLFWASVGDSRLYLYRAGELICPVRAHNYRLLLDRMLEAGRIDREVYRREEPKGEALVSYLGMGGLQMADISENAFLARPGDQILLCSDGLYKSLPDERIRQILASAEPPEARAGQLLDGALAAGGAKQDNTSGILLCL